MGQDAPEGEGRIRAEAAPIGKARAAADPRAFAAGAVRGWYLCLLVLSALLALLMGALGEAGLFVLFGVTSLYFFRRYRQARRGRATELPGAEEMARPERGGMPLAAIAVASILLAGSAASFYTTASAINSADDGICDYDHRPASALYQRTARNGSAVQTQEFCDDHIGYFLVLHPLQFNEMVPEGPGITFMGISPGGWVEIFAGLWALFISLMVLASVNLGSGWDPVFIVCSLPRGVLAMATGFMATILFMAAAVGLMVEFSDPAAYPRLTELLGGAGLNLPLYLATMLVIIAFLAAFFRQRGGAG